MGIHEEFVLLLTKFSAKDVAVSAAFAALGKMVEPEETHLLEDIPDDEDTDPLFPLTANAGRRRETIHPTPLRRVNK